MLQQDLFRVFLKLQLFPKKVEKVEKQQISKKITTSGQDIALSQLF